MLIDKIRIFLERGRKGYATSDLWSFDNWLSKLIANGLREFKLNCHSYPNDVDDWEEWVKILDEMIECFEEQTRDIEVNLKTEDFLEHWYKRHELQRQKLHRGLELLERYYYDLWN